jgi:hypothetical protein
MSNIQSVNGSGNQPKNGWSPTQSQTDDAKQAADRIESLIDSEGVFQVATRDEVTQAGNVLASSDKVTADAAIDELARRGSLDDFAKEVVDGSFVGPGLTIDNRTTLFDNFAKQLDADSLIRVSDAFRGLGNLTDRNAYVEELTTAINTHTSPAAKTEMVEQLAARAKTNTGTTPEEINQRKSDLEQAAHILSSLKGAHLQGTIETLSNSGMLNDVLAAAVTTDTQVFPRIEFPHVKLTHDTARFDKIMENVAALGDASVKADVFTAGVEAMQGIDNEDINPAVEFLNRQRVSSNDDEAANEMAASLTKVINSDVEGVMDILAYESKTDNGKAFTAYAKQMLEMGDNGPTNAQGKVFNANDALGEIFLKLQLGNGLNGNPVQRLERTQPALSGSGDTRPHGVALGYFVGSVYAASAQITTDKYEQAAYANAVIKSALTLVDKSKVGGAVVGTIASVAKETVALALYESISNDKLDAGQKWEEASVPERRLISDSAFSSLTDTIDHIFRLNN